MSAFASCFGFSRLPNFSAVVDRNPPMNASTPHYTLFSTFDTDCQPGRWRFVLRAADGSARLEAEDAEPDAHAERLELLAVVRGLEALDQPSRVTLMTPSPYVREGIRYGLAEWRKNGWRWEFFGQLVPVKNCDLWQRVDIALQFHQVDCRRWRIDRAHRPQQVSGWHVGRPSDSIGEGQTARSRWLRPAVEYSRRVVVALRRGVRRLVANAVALVPLLRIG
jgi:ribonuclease HI